MHVLSYEMKRAHWKMVGVAFETFGRVREAHGEETLDHMTPARYDILHAMYLRAKKIRAGEPRRGDDCVISMQLLVERLGLHRSTISKCVAV